jgi:hypothetical protein
MYCCRMSTTLFPALSEHEISSITGLTTISDPSPVG